jgi:hypothetical protein
MRESWKRLHFHSDRDAFLDNDLHRIQHRHGRFDLRFLGQVGSSILRCKAGEKRIDRAPNVEDGKGRFTLGGARRNLTLSHSFGSEE